MFDLNSSYRNSYRAVCYTLNASCMTTTLSVDPETRTLLIVAPLVFLLDFFPFLFFIFSFGSEFNI